LSFAPLALGVLDCLQFLSFETASLLPHSKGFAFDYYYAAFGVRPAMILE
jgi:hypothetical protein